MKINPTEKEKKQIIFQRRFGHGHYEVQVVGGQPVLFKEPLKTIKPEEVKERGGD